MEYRYIINIIFNSCALVMFNQNNFPLQWHVLWKTSTLARGQDTCHLHEITAIANGNDPISSRWIKLNPTLHFSCLRSRFTQVYVTIGKKRLSHLPFNVVCNPWSNFERLPKVWGPVLSHTSLSPCDGSAFERVSSQWQFCTFFFWECRHIVLVCMGHFYGTFSHFLKLKSLGPHWDCIWLHGKE